MAEDATIGIGVNVESDSRQLDRTIGKIEELSAEVAALGPGFAKAGAGLDKLAQAMSKTSIKPLTAAAHASRELARAQAEGAKQAIALARAQDLFDARRSAGYTVAPRDTRGTAEAKLNAHYFEQQLRSRHGITRAAAAQLQAEKANSAELYKQRQHLADIEAKFGAITAKQRAAGTNITPTGAGSAQGVASRMLADSHRLERNELKALQGDLQAHQGALAAVRAQYNNILAPQRNLVAHLEAEEAVTNRLTNARYAMFAAGASLMAGSYAIGRAMLGTVQAAMDYETALAQIERTSGMTGLSLQAFAGDLRDMSSTIPLAFADISEIATLGGQLNISQDNLEGFTRSVAQFGMTTNVQAGTAAEAFGRLNGLLPDVNDNYDALGSAILNVGVNSVATESDIIATATQIAAVGAQAGFSASDVIGFAGAMRSVGLNPYLSRGGLTRIFGQISTAIAEGGAQLETFSALSGVAAADFEGAWRTNAADTFVDLLRGMENARQGGEDLYQIMGQLGIVNSQDMQVLAVLSQNYDELTSAMGYASEGFTEGTQLQDAFAVQAETLASKLQMLMNSLHAMFGVLAGPALIAFGPIVDGLSAIAQGVTDLVSASPILQTVLGSLGGIATVGAGLGIVAGGMTLFVAASIAARTAMRTVNTEMEIARLAIMEQRAATLVNNTAQAANVAETTRRVAAQRALVTSLGGAAAADRAAASAALGTAGANSAANAAAVTGVSRWQAYRQVLFGAEVGATAFGRAMSGVTGLLGGPVGIAIMAATTAMVAFDAAQRSVNASTEEWHALLREAPRAENIFAMADRETMTDDFMGLTPTADFSFMDDIERLPALLERTAAMADNWWERLNGPANVGLPLGELESQLGRIGTMMASMEFPQMQAAFASMVESSNLSRQAAMDLLTSMGPVREAALAYADAQGIAVTNTEGAVVESRLLALMMQDVGVASQDAAMIGSEGMYYLADSAAEAGGEMQTVADILSSEFAMPTMLGELGNAMRDFATGIAEGGMIFAAVSAEGAVNVANFQALVASAIVAGQSQGIGAAQSIATLFATLKAQGLDVMAILGALRAQGVANIGGVAMAQLQQSATSAEAPVSRLGNYMRTAYANAQARAAAATNRTSRALGGGGSGGGGGGGSRPKSGLGGAARAAAVEVRTLVDYSNDLKKVMSRAFEMRFGSGQAFDKITEGWLEIAEATAKAQESIADANRELEQSQAKMSELTADRAIQQYFMDMAVAYEDFLRAGEIGANIAKIDADLADAQADVSKTTAERADAEKELNKRLVGNDKASIENRKTVLELAESYQEYLVALAASGMSQGELSAKSRELKAQFMAQGIAAGYSATELDVYAKSFEDLSTIIARVPYNVTVGFNADPALQALAEFEAELASKAARAGDAAGRALGGGIAGGLGGGLGGIGGGIGMPEMPPLEELFPELFGDMPTGIKPLKPKINTGTQIVRPGEIQIYDPSEENTHNPRSDIKRGKSKPDPVDESGAPIYTSDTYWGSISHGVAGAVLRGIAEADVPKAVKQGKVGEHLKQAIGQSADWNGVGLKAGSQFSGGAKNAVRKIRLGGEINDEIKRANWTSTGSTIGTSVSSALKVAYAGQQVGKFAVGQVKDSDWTARGGSVGRGFASTLKTGFSAQNPGTTLLNNVKDSNWTAGGSSSGNKFGGGMKRGVSDARTAGAVLDASTGGNWHQRGTWQGGDLGSGVKVGFSSQNVGSRIASAVADANWHSHGRSAGWKIADGIKTGFNEKAIKVPGAGGAGSPPLKMYQSGGWTGGTGRNDIAGYVHGQEFVMPASATQRLGLANLEYMRHTGTIPGNGGSMTNGMVVTAELSPHDRALLAAVGNVNLELTGGGVASITGAANVRAVRRGGN